ncbi:MAG: hypothetical protein U9P72_02285 [Campylobacterota bacterium]|nr:hypothetical protein [Campylobacterota bacterium]
MIYLAYLFFSLLFIYNTPLVDTFIKYVKTRTLIIRVISIFGDSLYMIGGGIVAGHMIEIKLINFTVCDLVFNYGTIMVVIGAFIREYFNRIKDRKWNY